MSNPYLIRATERYEALKSGIEGIQTRAAEEGRDMTQDELRTAQGQNDEAKRIFAEIELLSENEKRNAQVANVRSAVMAAGAAAGEQVRQFSNGVVAQERDPGHYRTAKNMHGKVVPVGRSWFADLYAAQREGNVDAQNRLREHDRASGQVRTGDTTATVPGVIQPVYFTDLFTQMMQQMAVLSALAPSIPISSANPFYLPGQTALTTEVDHASENGVVTSSDSYAAAYASPVTPTVLTAKETISRELLDGSNPAVDALILGDFARTMVATKENKLGTIIRAVGSALAPTQAEWVALGTATTNAWDETITAALDVRKALFERPDAYVMDYDLFASLLTLKDGNNRPLLVSADNGPMNAMGNSSTAADGMFAGLPVYVSAGMKGGTSTTWYGAVLATRYIQQFESPMLSFRYEEQAGPQSIILGAWQYWAAAARQSTRAAKNITVTVS